MPCPREEMLVQFVRRDLDAAKSLRVEEHLDRCGECREWVAERAERARRPLFSSEHDDVAVDGDLARGAKVGRYVVLERVGRGAMGIVFGAYDPQLDRRVALKILRHDLDRDKARGRLQDRLFREGRAMARVAHPNVLHVYDVTRVGRRVVIAMEFVVGVTLREWVDAAPRSWRDILGVYQMAGRGLAAAHQSGVIHRDFKPDNVLVDKSGHAVVTDLGLAKPLESGVFPGGGRSSNADGQPAPADLGPSLWRDGMPLGTPAYMAPEVITGRPADARSDQFSYCVALHEALYGMRPFAGDTLDDMRANIERGDVRLPSRSTVPGWLKAVVLRGLRADAHERYPTMKALSSALAKGHARRRRTWLPLSAAVVAGAVGVSVMLLPTRITEYRCQSGIQRLRGVWDEQARKGIERAFRAADTPFGRTAWKEVDQALNR